MTKRHRIAILHFQPVEYYPPVQNIIRFLGKELSEAEILVVTSSPRENAKLFKAEQGTVRILRTGHLSEQMSRWQRLFFYVGFNMRAVRALTSFSATHIFYFETLSSFPAFLYKRFFGRRTPLLIHYHEYTSPAEYAAGMALTRFFHRFERQLYPKASWISHTNQQRMEFFLRDEALKQNPSVQHVLPNYPPAAWAGDKKAPKSGQNLRIVYAGALGLDTMYIAEMVRWVEAQQGKVLFDIYSQQEGVDVRNFLVSAKARFTKHKGSVSYDELPATLRQYDVGVILYKGHIPNYVYNAPNKLFEYLACGLDVWFPQQMLGSLPYVRTDRLPKIAAINFESLDSELTPELLSHDGLTKYPGEFTCEEVLLQLLPYLNANL